MLWKGLRNVHFSLKWDNNGTCSHYSKMHLREIAPITTLKFTMYTGQYMVLITQQDVANCSRAEQQRSAAPYRLGWFFCIPPLHSSPLPESPLASPASIVPPPPTPSSSIETPTPPRSQLLPGHLLLPLSSSSSLFKSSSYATPYHHDVLAHTGKGMLVHQIMAVNIKMRPRVLPYHPEFVVVWKLPLSDQKKSDDELQVAKTACCLTL